nr:hypothetical protein [uncultured Methanolobus sp.]
MNILQIRDKINIIMNSSESDYDENDLKEVRLHFSNLVEEFKLKLEITDDSDQLTNITEEDKKNFDMPSNLMFLVYQRLLKLEPQKSTLLDFANYLWIVGGPDWKEELDLIRKFADEDKIPEAVDVALKVDYHK